MQVELINDGPVTVWLDTRQKEKTRDAPAGLYGFNLGLLAWRSLSRAPLASMRRSYAA
jgi:hypothetical protein